MRLTLSALFCLASASLFASDPPRHEAAMALYKQSRFSEARTAFEALIREEGNAQPELHYGLGMCELSLNNPTVAIQLLEKAVALDPAQHRYFHGLGDAYGAAALKAGLFSKLGLAKKCIAAYDRAVALAPDVIQYRKSRYEFYRAAPSIAGGGTDKASAELVEIEKRDSVQGACLRSDMKLKENNPDEALAILTGLVRQFPGNKIARYQLGRFAAMTGRNLDEGAEALRDYLNHAPEASEPPLWSAHWRLAQIMEKKGALPEARTHYEETLRLNPVFDRAREALQRLR